MEERQRLKPMLEATSEIPQINVLIVDDSKLARVHLARLLEKENMLCDMAESAEDMLHYLQDGRPDVIFLDHNMPGMSGLAALKIIKANPSTATIPVMMYTSESDEVYLGQARALGAFDVLVKEELEPLKLTQRLHELQLRPKPPVQTKVFEVKVDKTQEIEEQDFFSPRQRLERNNARMLQQIHQEQWRGQPVDPNDALEVDAPVPVRRPLPQLDTDLERAPVQYFLVPLAVFLGGILLALGLFHTFVSPLHFDEPEVAAVSTPQPVNRTEREGSVAQSQPAPVTTSITPAADNMRVDLILDALSWAMRSRMSYPYNELPLAGDRLSHLQTLLNYLDSAGFEGVVRLKVYRGRFCMVGTPAGKRVLPADGMPLNSCQFGLLLDNPNVKDYQSREFTRFIETSPMANGTRSITVELEAIPEMSNPFPYPSESSINYASEWNAIADKNNLVQIELERS